MSITRHVCVFVALGMQYSMRMRHIVICGMPGSDLRKKKLKTLLSN